MEVPYSSPVPVSSYPSLSIMLLLAGLTSTAGYFVYQMKSGSKNIVIELLIAAVSSVLLGFGTLFAMLSFGLYV
eukprot:gene10676-14337_t